MDYHIQFKKLQRQYWVALVAIYMVGALLFAYVLLDGKAYAVEISPEIGLHHQHLNGSVDTNNGYQSKSQKHEDALNDKIFRDGHIGKTVPDVNSVGLNFTFKLG